MKRTIAAGCTPPLLSTVIPVYNRGARVQSTIDSALRQHLPDATHEVIVIDDGSSDGTGEFLTRTYGNHPQVRLFHQTNRGVAAARNTGLKAARGEFIAFLDHDDIWLPEKLQKQLTALQSTPTAAVAYCRWIDVDEAGDPLPDTEQTIKQSWWQPREGRVLEWFCAPRNPIVSMSVPLIRAQALREVGGFDPAMVPADDLDLWLRLSARYDFVFVPEDLILYVHHAHQQGSDPARAARTLKKVYGKHWRCLLKHPSLFWYVATFRFFLRSAPVYQEAKTAQHAAKRQTMWKLIGQTARRHPLALLSPQWIVLLFRFFTARGKS